MITTGPVMEVTTQMLLDAGINAFALQLLSESLAGKKDIKTFRPIRFSYRGVIYTLEPVKGEGADEVQQGRAEADREL